ncbi:hypothetical protein CRUP_003100 [Coryphaenoides rupestris]|nr:hypothetical protein CRUP_003100 [Coryphaenoides rupestris]
MKDFIIKHVNLERRENQEAHRTEGFANNMSLVVRRGAPFKVSLQLKGRAFNPKTDALVFKFRLGGLYVKRTATFSTGPCPTSWGVSFNPEEDAVFVLFEDQREEYVLNDSGLLYMGTPGSLVARPWSFDQVGIPDTP